MDETVLIAGAGLSAAAGLPTTNELTNSFLDAHGENGPLEAAISEELRKYRRTVFGYTGGKRRPSFEDHFTVLDLSANSGHHLGAAYTPRQLRAILLRAIRVLRVSPAIEAGLTNHVWNIREFLTVPTELESAAMTGESSAAAVSEPHKEAMPEVHPPTTNGDAQGHQFTATPRTKSFLKIGLEVVLISAGVFLGLLGEEWRENAEHQTLADASLRRFRAEFRANKAEVERVHGRHLEQLQALEKYFSEHQTALLDPRQPVPQPVPDMATDSAGVAYAAWDVALATQSLAYIDPDLVAAMSSAYRLQQMYEDAHRHIQQAQYSANIPIQLMRGHMTYFGDASLYEELLLKHYDAILSRLDKAVGN